MGNIIGDLSSAQVIILVDQNGNDITTGQKVCEPSDAKPVIFVKENGNQA